MKKIKKLLKNIDCKYTGTCTTRTDIYSFVKNLVITDFIKPKEFYLYISLLNHIKDLEIMLAKKMSSFYVNDSRYELLKTYNDEFYYYLKNRIRRIKNDIKK